QATTSKGLDLLQGRVDLANGAVRARMDAAYTAQPGKVCQHEAEITTGFALATRKLRASVPTLGPRLSTGLLSRASCSIGAITPALPLDGCPPGVRAGEDVF